MIWNNLSARKKAILVIGYHSVIQEKGNQLFIKNYFHNLTGKRCGAYRTVISMGKFIAFVVNRSDARQFSIVGHNIGLQRFAHNLSKMSRESASTLLNNHRVDRVGAGRCVSAQIFKLWNNCVMGNVGTVYRTVYSIAGVQRWELST